MTTKSKQRLRSVPLRRNYMMQIFVKEKLIVVISEKRFYRKCDGFVANNWWNQTGVHSTSFLWGFGYISTIFTFNKSWSRVMIVEEPALECWMYDLLEKGFAYLTLDFCRYFPLWFWERCNARAFGWLQSSSGLPSSIVHSCIQKTSVKNLSMSLVWQQWHPVAEVPQKFLDQEPLVLF